MAQFAPTGPASPSVVSTRSKTTPNIQTLDLTLANTEYSISIPTASVSFAIRTRNCSKLKLTFSSAAPDYFTVWPGETYKEEGLVSTASITLYIQSSTAGEVLEVLSWT